MSEVLELILETHFHHSLKIHNSCSTLTSNSYSILRAFACGVRSYLAGKLHEETICIMTRFLKALPHKSMRL